ncbi:MAG: choline dehydrogenase, partial [Pseudomonadales bacterium]|nr:choline dehydrogenase [Pseudomonadales bacterium]
GCVLANRLSADAACRVLLLEAGGVNRSVFIRMPAALSIPIHRRAYNWGYVSEPEADLDGRRVGCPRGRGLGGSSAINGMVYVRGHGCDFDGWCDTGAVGWGYADVLPYFRRAERCLDAAPGDAYRGRSGLLATRNGEQRNPLYRTFLEACEQAGYALSADLNGHRQEGFGALPMTVADGERCSAARAYLQPVRDRANLTVTTRALVERVSVEGGCGRKVVWRKGRRWYVSQAGCEVVVCAGAIDSPCILQRSGIGPERLLREHRIPVEAPLPVGENLMDHLEIYLQQACAPEVSLNRSLNVLNRGWIGARWLMTRDGLGATNHFEVGGFIRSAAGIQWPNIQFHFLPAAMSYDGRRVAPVPGYQVHIGPMLPASRGSVCISSDEAGAAPRIRFNYLAEKEDRLIFRQSVKLAREILAQPALARYNRGELQPGAEISSDDAIDAFIRASAESAYHPCGTCRMGVNEYSVVDVEGRVHGIEGLRVADASLFPVITNGNLNAPTIMLAEKIAGAMTGDVLAPDPKPVFVDGQWRTRQR